MYKKLFSHLIVFPTTDETSLSLALMEHLQRMRRSNSLPPNKRAMLESLQAETAALLSRSESLHANEKEFSKNYFRLHHNYDDAGAKRRKFDGTRGLL